MSYVTTLAIKNVLR